MKYLKVFVIVIFTLFSFYYTDKMVGISVSNDPIMKKIKEVSNDKYIKPVSLVVHDNTVKAGLVGKKVNEDLSYEKMKKLGSFNENFLVFDDIKPNEDIKDYYDKYVIGGASDSKISFVFTTSDKEKILGYQDVLESYGSFGMFFFDGVFMEQEKEFLSNLKDKYNTILIGNYGYDDKYEKNTLGYTNSFIYRYSNKTNFYCINKDNNDVEVCKNGYMSTIKPIKVPDQKTFNSFKNLLVGGMIYHYDGEISDLKSILQYVYQKGYEVVSLDELLNNK